MAGLAVEDQIELHKRFMQRATGRSTLNLSTIASMLVQHGELHKYPLSSRFMADARNTKRKKFDKNIGSDTISAGSEENGEYVLVDNSTLGENQVSSTTALMRAAWLGKLRSVFCSKVYMIKFYCSIILISFVLINILCCVELIDFFRSN